VIPFVAAPDEWTPAEPEAYLLDPKFRSVITRFGPATAGRAKDGLWHCDILAESPDSHQEQFGFALQVAIAFAHHGEPTVRLYQIPTVEHYSVHVTYRDRRESTDLEVTREQAQFRLSGLHKVMPPDSAQPDQTTLGMRPGDTVGLLHLVVPPRSVLDGITLDYKDVFRCTDDATLRRWFDGKVVLVCNLIDQAQGNVTIEATVHQAAATIRAPEVQAIAIDMLINGRAIEFAMPVVEWFGMIVAGAIGLVLGGSLASRHISRIAAVLFIAIATLFGSLFIFQSTLFAYRPEGFVLSLLLSTEIVAWATRFSGKSTV
jgi:hypothetical protein